VSPSIFLSHNALDKTFARKLAGDLDCHGVKVWLDEAELKVGDSLIEKIREGIDTVDYVAVVLSPNSVSSRWVQKEVDVAMTLEVQGKQMKVLPLMLQSCELPGFLLGKFYADFTEPSKYVDSFRLLAESIGVVFNRSALIGKTDASNLGAAIDKASRLNLPIFATPFHRPFQYLGLSIDDAANRVGASPNKVGNIILDTPDCHMVLWGEGNFVTFVEVDIKKTAPCKQSEEFDSEPILGALSVNPAELDFASKQTHVHTYYDHKRKMKITVSCVADGEPIGASFGVKYYKM
jgi:hypothetical protein